MSLNSFRPSSSGSNALQLSTVTVLLIWTALLVLMSQVSPLSDVYNVTNETDFTNVIYAPSCTSSLLGSAVSLASFHCNCQESCGSHSPQLMQSDSRLFPLYKWHLVTQARNAFSEFDKASLAANKGTHLHNGHVSPYTPIRV